MRIRALILVFALAFAACGRKAENIKADKRSTYPDAETSANQALFYAIDSREVIMLEQALKEGANVNLPFKNGETPLTLTITKQKPELLKSLLAANPNLNAPNVLGYYPTHMALELDYRAGLVDLLNAGADVNIKNENGMTLLEVAIDRSDEESAIHIIKANPDLSKIGNELRRLAKREDLERAANLIEFVMSLGNEISKSNLKDIVLEGNKDFIEFLVKNRSFKKLANGANLLAEIVSKLEPSKAETLSSYLIKEIELNPNGEALDDRVPLIEAVKEEKLSLVESLIRDQADPNKLDSESKTALFYAVEALLPEHVGLLHSNKAQNVIKVTVDGAQYDKNVCVSLPNEERRGFFRRLFSKKPPREERDKINKIKFLLGCY